MGSHKDALRPAAWPLGRLPQLCTATWPACTAMLQASTRAAQLAAVCKDEGLCDLCAHTPPKSGTQTWRLSHRELTLGMAA